MVIYKMTIASKLTDFLFSGPPFRISLFECTLTPKIPSSFLDQQLTMLFI